MILYLIYCAWIYGLISIGVIAYTVLHIFIVLHMIIVFISHFPDTVFRALSIKIFKKRSTQLPFIFEPKKTPSVAIKHHIVNQNWFSLYFLTPHDNFQLLRFDTTSEAFETAHSTTMASFAMQLSKFNENSGRRGCVKGARECYRKC